MRFIIVFIGVILVYISSVMMILIHIREQKKLKWYDWVVAFIPIARAIYISITIEEE